MNQQTETTEEGEAVEKEEEKKKKKKRRLEGRDKKLLFQNWSHACML